MKSSEREKGSKSVLQVKKKKKLVMNNASQGYLDEPGPTNNMYVHIYKYLYSVYTALDIS